MAQPPAAVAEHPAPSRKGIWCSLLGLMLLCAITIHRCQLPFPDLKDLAFYADPHDPVASFGERLAMIDNENLDDEEGLALDEDGATEAEKKSADFDEIYKHLRRSYTDRGDAAMARWRGRIARVGDATRQ